MPTTVNADILREFIVRQIDGNKLEKYEASDLDIDADLFKEADADKDGTLSLDEIEDNEELYELFATMYVAEEDKKAEAKDKEKQKEEQVPVSEGQGGAKA